MDMTFEGTCKAPPETVWEVLADSTGYTKFVPPVRKVVIEREGDPPPQGKGTIRALHAVGPPIREEVVEFEPPHSFSYVMLSGAPLKNHRGDVTLSPEGTGTRIVYKVHTEPAVPVIGHLSARIAKQAVRGIFNGVIREAERRST